MELLCWDCTHQPNDIYASKHPSIILVLPIHLFLLSQRDCQAVCQLHDTSNLPVQLCASFLLKENIDALCAEGVVINDDKMPVPKTVSVCDVGNSECKQRGGAVLAMVQVKEKLMLLLFLSHEHGSIQVLSATKGGTSKLVKKLIFSNFNKNLGRPRYGCN